MKQTVPQQYQTMLRRTKFRRILSRIRGQLPLIIGVFLTALLALVLILYAEAKQPRSGISSPTLQIYIFDVGQGDAILLCSEGQAALIDAGDVGCGLKIAQTLHRLGIPKLQYLINSHPHSDHMGGMTELVAETDVGAFFMPDFPESLTPTVYSFTSLMEMLNERHVPLMRPVCGQTLPLGQAEIRLLCTDNSARTDLNNCSLGCVVTSGDFRFFAAGDLEAEGEADMHALLEPVTVLKVSHHGSNTSSTAEFLAALSPDTAVISCGAWNDYGHPAQGCLERLHDAGVLVYRTDLDGTIQLETDGTVYSIITEK